MKLTTRKLRQIIRESFLAPLTKEKYAFNKKLTRILSEITEDLIPFGNDPELDAALGDIEQGMLRLKKAVIASGSTSLREYNEERMDRQLMADRTSLSPSTINEITDMILDYFEYDELDTAEYDQIVNELVYPILLRIEQR